jgi:hypothetical protein
MSRQMLWGWFYIFMKNKTRQELKFWLMRSHETMANAKRMTPAAVRRMCFGDRLHTDTS